jgi:hypothetical protein
MNSPIYTFGPHAHPTAALSLKDALAATFPSFSFDVETASSRGDLREVVVFRGDASTNVWEQMIMFSRGFVAGFGGGIEPPTRQQALRRTVTRADCPAAKRKSDPPPPDSSPALTSQPASQLSVRHPTLMGVPFPWRG